MVEYINRIITAANDNDMKAVLAICEEALREARVTETRIGRTDTERRRALMAAIKDACKIQTNSATHGIGIFDDAQSWANGYWGVWLEGDDRLPELPLAPSDAINIKKIVDGFRGQEIDLAEIHPDKVAAVIRDRDIKKKLAGKAGRKQAWFAFFDLGEGRPMYNADYLLAAFKVLPGPVERAVISEAHPNHAPIVLYSKSSYALIMPVSKKEGA